MRLFYLAFAGLLVGSLGTSGCGSACTLIGCGDSFSIVFEEGSTWGEGKHRVSVDTWLGYTYCTIYPFYSGLNAVCHGNSEITVTNQGIFMTFAPEQLRIEIKDENDWLFKESFTPDYDENYPNGKSCDKTPCLSAQASLRLDGPGKEAVKTSFERDRPPFFEPAAQGGAGGASPSISSIGTACGENSHCSLPQFCTDDFMGGQLVCSMSCTTDAGCLGDSKCLNDIISEKHELISGYCLQPCTDEDDCQTIGSSCREQPIGKFCF